jgi:hypothetical protein
MDKNPQKTLAKAMRFIGEDNFTYGVRLNVKFDDISESIDAFTSVLAMSAEGVPIGKPIFNAVMPSYGYTMPLLTSDYFLIGFTDCLNKRGVSFRFVFEHCGIEYIHSQERMPEILKLECFIPDCLPLEVKYGCQ